jgi:hypothetical protein
MKGTRLKYTEFYVVLYGCATWSLTLTEEHRLRVFRNKALRKVFGSKRKETIGGQTILRAAEQPGREVNHSPPSSAEVKNEWSHTSTPIRLHGVDKEYFTLFFTCLQNLFP